MLFENFLSGAPNHITACMLGVYFSSWLIHPLTSLLSSVPCMLTWFSLNQLVGTMPNKASRRRELLDNRTVSMRNQTDPHQMTYLSISNNALSGTISEAVCNLTNITALIMNNMAISGSLPFCTGQMSKLQIFSSARCGISLTWFCKSSAALITCRPLLSIVMQELHRFFHSRIIW